MLETLEALRAPQIYSRSEIVRELGVAEGTIRKYEDRFGVPSWKQEGKCYYSAESLKIFRQIQALYAEGLDKESIAATIGPALEAERERIATRPQEAGIDLDGLRNELVRVLKHDIQDHEKSVVDRILAGITQEYGSTREQLGEYKAQVQYLASRLAEVEQQTKLLPAQAESLRDAQERTRWAEEEARRAQHQQSTLTESLEAAQNRIRELERTEQALQLQLAQAELAMKHAEEQASDLHVQLVEAKGRIGLLEQEIETERRKTWLDKLTKK